VNGDVVEFHAEGDRFRGVYLQDQTA
jgi:hypothetical protein